MSFSNDVKTELSRRIDEERLCRIAELSAVIRFAGRIDREKPEIEIHTENVMLAKKYYTLIKKTFSGKVLLSIRGLKGEVKNRRYSIVVRDAALIRELLQAIHYGEDAQMEQKVLGMEEALRAFIRGAFLVSGSVSDPGKSYHFEIVCRDEEQANRLCRQICYFEISAKIIQRKTRYIVYVKDSNGIVELLKVMGAGKASMDLENVRIIKDMRNSANRQYNCDAANINKMVKASARQLEDIHLLERTIGLDSLPPALCEMARVRLAHPEESLQELGQYLDPPVGKSGVNHRLRKLSQMAEDLK